MIEAPDFDPELHNHSAVGINSVCHAVVSDVHDGEYRSDLTECGLVLENGRFDGIERRLSFTKQSISMCQECWPKSVHKGDPA